MIIGGVGQKQDDSSFEMGKIGWLRNDVSTKENNKIEGAKKTKRVFGVWGWEESNMGPIGLWVERLSDFQGLRC